MEKQKHYVVLNNGDRIEYPAPQAWEYLPDCKKCHGEGNFGGGFGWICEECEGTGKDYSKKVKH